MKILKRNFSRVNIPKWFRLIELFIFELKITQLIVKSYVFDKLMFLSFLKAYAKARCAEFVNFDESEDEVFIVYGNTGHKCFPPNVLNTFSGEISEKKYGMSIHVAVLESLRIYLGRYLKSDLFAEVILYDKNSNRIDALRMRFPISPKKHGIGQNNLGTGWLQLDIDFEKYDVALKSFSVRFMLIEGIFQAIRAGSTKSRELKAAFPIVATSKPLFWEKDSSQNKLLIVAESMTDPTLFMDFDEIKLRMPNYSRLADMSHVFSQSVSMVDSTLPHIGSWLTGLFPSQHKIGDYLNSPDKEKLDPNIKTVLGVMREREMRLVGFASYGVFGFNYVWPSLFDEYYHVRIPYEDNAANASTLVRHMAANKNTPTFFYFHFSRLHLPLLSTSLTQTPCRIPMSATEKILSANDYSELYKKQYEEFDLELGQILGFLETSDSIEDFDIILTGDHGVKMPPKWKGQIDPNYDLYEEHIRVPLIYKKRGSRIKKVNNLPVSSQAVIFKILADNPSFGLPMLDDVLGAYSISETIYHPNKNSLAIAVRTEGYKFWVLFIDCIRGGQVTVELPSKILLFERESDDFNENNDVSGSHPRLVKEFMRLCSQHLTKDYIMTEEHKEKN